MTELNEQAMKALKSAVDMADADADKFHAISKLTAIRIAIVLATAIVEAILHLGDAVEAGADRINDGLPMAGKGF